MISFYIIQQGDTIRCFFARAMLTPMWDPMLGNDTKTRQMPGIADGVFHVRMGTAYADDQISRRMV